MGRNSAFDVAIAVVAGVVDYAFSQRAVFLLVPVFAVLASIAVLSIPEGDRLQPDERPRQRGKCGGATTSPAGYGSHVISIG
jgi:hypothetical protein